MYMTRPIVSQKTLAVEAKGRLSKSFGIGQLCLASVIAWFGCGILKMVGPTK